MFIKIDNKDNSFTVWDADEAVAYMETYNHMWHPVRTYFYITGSKKYEVMDCSSRNTNLNK